MDRVKLLCVSIMLAVASTGAARAETSRAGQGAEKSGDIVLVSNARAAVTKADFEAEIERVPEQDRLEFLASRERIGKVLEEMLVRKTLAVEARQAGLDKLPVVIRKMAAAQENALAAERIKELAQGVKLPDFRVRAREIYRIETDKYTVKPMVRASHILVNFKERSKDEALKRAEEVYALAKSGNDFGALAEKYSDDSSNKASKGDLGYFSADMMVKPFSDAAFAMKPGEISAPVETQFGFHVLRLDDAKPGYKQDFDTVSGAIIEQLKAEYLTELKKNHLVDIRADSTIKVNEEEILKIKTTLPVDGHK
ncbi:MAG: hypothetical protein A2Z65_07740 [Gallionellales bacterium RIFCSPLOWO2_02_58_13]|nr:MAG: hypothetical protein A2Z65_07740 [Gallionellales bacterium RIFCSPLOWO2_02_58_13]